MADFDLQALMEQAVRNPAGFQRVAIDYIQYRAEGTVPDPLSPLVQMLEIGSTQTALSLDELAASDRRRYPILANTYADLYANMTDRDYDDRFSTPATAPFILWLEYDNIVSLMVPVGTSGAKKLVIPRYTVFKISNRYNFTLLYPIEIRMLPSGALSVVYNTNILNPLQTLSDNVLPFFTSRDQDGVKRLRIDFTLMQLDRITENLHTVSGASANFNLEYTDLFYAARVYRKVSGNWVEMRTTHSEEQHDVRYPTAYLRVDSGVVNVSIPPVYFTQNMISDDLRVDIYTSKGALEIPLGAVDAAQFSWDWGVDLDDPTNSRYWKGITDANVALFSDGLISGGSNGLTFEQLRERVIASATGVTLPIMPGQLVAKLNVAGYSATLGRDDVDGRIYYLTKALPNNPASSFPVPIACGIGRLQISMDALSHLPGVKDNGRRVTITPAMLMAMDNGVLGALNSAEYPENIVSTTDNLISQVNSRDYVYSPFHYVLDASGSNFGLRGYYLQNPKLQIREFLEENPSTLLSVSTQAFALTRTVTGYTLTVNCKPSDTYADLDTSQVHLQLAFTPGNESSLAYQNGTLLGIVNGVWTWQFTFDTDWDLDEKDNLIVKNFLLFDTTPRNLALGLSTRFYLVHAVSDYSQLNMEGSDVDKYKGMFLLPKDAVGVQVEAATFQFGTALTKFWSGSRTVMGSEVYELYTEDVLKYYASDVYDIDPDTGKKKYTIVDGKIVYTKLHAKGDPVIGGDGKQEFAWNKGQVKLDDAGQPIVTSPRPTNRVLDLFVMDGKYFYANDSASQADKRYLPDRIADTYLPAIAQILGVGIQNTLFYFYPKTTIGDINVLIEDARSTTMDARLSVQLKIYLTELANNDENYKERLKQLLSSIINSQLNKETVSALDILAEIRDSVDENVKGLDMKLFTGDKEITTFSAGDETVRATVRRNLVLLDDGKLGVAEDITYDFRTLTSKTDSLYSTTSNRLTQV